MFTPIGFDANPANNVLSDCKALGVMELADQLELLLGNFDHLKSRIRHLSFDTDVCGERTDVRCSYIAFRDAQPTFDEFIDVVALHVTSFCLPRSSISEASAKAKNGDHVQAGIAFTELTERAKSLFIKARKGSHRSGEGGELVLYIFNEWILKAPQIVSKMYLKTNHNMPVHGTDGIHAKFDVSTKTLHLYWGESKAHASLSGALSAALNSIADFVNDHGEKREIEIVSNFLDKGAWDGEAQQALLRYLDPYDELSNERIAVYSCLLVHEHSYAAKPSGSLADPEAAFVEDVRAAIEKFIEQLKDEIDGKGLALKRFEFFLLPVPSVQAFRDKFQARIGWPND